MSGDAASGGRDVRLLLFAVILTTAVTILQFARCMQEGHCSFAEDFPVFYGSARALHDHAPASPYPVRDAEAWLKNPAGGVFHYSLYPPASLLLFYPLGLFSTATALDLWFGVQLLILAAGLMPRAMRQILFPARQILVIPAKAGILAKTPAFAGVTREDRRDEVPYLNPSPLILLFPFVTLCLLAGQVGIALAGFFALAFLWRRDHPVRSALMLALLTLKPQFALLLPVLMLAEGRIRLLLIAGVFMLLLQGAATAFFGPAIWRDYARMLALAPHILAVAPPQLLKMSLSPALALRMLGAAPGLCLALQAALSLGAILLAWRAARRGMTEGRLLWLIATGTFLTSPYMFQYDTVLLAFPAMVLLRRQAEGLAGSFERVSLILLAFLPLIALKLQALHIPYGCLAVAVAFSCALRLPKGAPS